jgi:hypothetical protein
MDVDVVAAADTAQLEAQAFSEFLKVREGHVLDLAASEPRQELAPIHAPTVTPA